ncbi:addiction module protein [Pricia sp.]|uniref:addiction module protein n=1 Tax=Pricia sp. TaxID=2268138 RepID=UPI003593E0C6
MATIDLKKSVQDYVEMADERLLRMIKALVETYQEGESDFEISQDHKKILDGRLEDYQKNPDSLLDWEDVKQSW